MYRLVRGVCALLMFNVGRYCNIVYCRELNTFFVFSYAEILHIHSPHLFCLSGWMTWNSSSENWSRQHTSSPVKYRKFKVHLTPSKSGWMGNRHLSVVEAVTLPKLLPVMRGASCHKLSLRRIENVPNVGFLDLVCHVASVAVHIQSACIMRPFLLYSLLAGLEGQNRASKNSGLGVSKAVI